MLKLREIPPYQPTMAVIILILYLTLLPKPFGDEELPLFAGADKVAHFMMFRKPLNPTGALLTALCSTMLGALVEWLQYSMHLGRTGNDIYDVLANTLGAFVAVPVCMALHWVNVTIDRRP